MDTQEAAGPVEAPRRSLSTSNAVAAVATGWVLAMAAGLLLAARAAGWPGSRLGLLIVSVAALGAIVWSQWASRARSRVSPTGPTTWTVPDARTRTQRRDRARRLEDALRRGHVAHADRPAATHLVGEHLATAATSMFTATMPTVIGLTNLASDHGGFFTTVSVLLVVVGAATMTTSTVTVLRWRRRTHWAGLHR